MVKYGEIFLSKGPWIEDNHGDCKCPKDGVVMIPDYQNEGFDYRWDCKTKWGKTRDCKKGDKKGVTVKMKIRLATKTRIWVVGSLKMTPKTVKKMDCMAEWCIKIVETSGVLIVLSI